MKVIVNKGSVVADEELLDRAENYAVHLFYHENDYEQEFEEVLYEVQRNLLITKFFIDINGAEQHGHAYNTVTLGKGDNKEVYTLLRGGRDRPTPRYADDTLTFPKHEIHRSTKYGTTSGKTVACRILRDKEHYGRYDVSVQGVLHSRNLSDYIQEYDDDYMRSNLLEKTFLYHKTKLATDAGFCHLTKYEETQ